MLPMYLTLGVFVLLVIGFVSQKFPLGAVAMGCVTLLYLMGVLTFKEAYENFANANVILVGSMFVLSAALGKTPLVDKLNAFIIKYAGGNPRRVLFFFLLAVAVLMQFLPPTATLTMLLPFALIMDRKGSLGRTKSMFALAVSSFMWQGVLPLSMGISLTAQLNGYMEAGGAVATAALQDRFIIGFVPAAIGVIFLLTIGYKLLPDKPTVPLAEDDIKGAEAGDKQFSEAAEKPTTREDKFIYAIFAVVIAAMFVIPDSVVKSCVIPVVGCLALIATGCMKDFEVFKALNLNILFMLAGIMGLSTALSKTGGADLIANAIVSVIGEGTHPVIVIAIFYFVACIVSQAFSNAGTMALLIPLMAATAVKMGVSPAAVGQAVMFGANADALLPVGSPGMAIAFGAGGYKFTDMLKPGIVMMFVYGFSVVAMVYLYYYVFV